MIRGALDEATAEIHRKSGLEANFVAEGRLVAFCVGSTGEVPGLIFRLKEDRSGVEVVYGTINFEGADISGREKSLETTWHFEQVTRDAVLEAVVSWAEAEFEAP